MHPATVLAEELGNWRNWVGGRLSFDTAWSSHMPGVAAESDDPKFWLAVFREQEDAWRRAYDLEPPTRAELALLALVDGRPVASEAPCALCGGVIPPERLRPAGRPARFCSDRCRRASSRQAVAQRRTFENESPETSDIRAMTASTLR